MVGGRHAADSRDVASASAESRNRAGMGGVADFIEHHFRHFNAAGRVTLEHIVLPIAPVRTYGIPHCLL